MDAAVTLNNRWPHRKWTDEDGEKYSGWRRFVMDEFSLYTAVVENGWAFAPSHIPTTLICTKSFQCSHYLVADIDEACDAMELLDRHCKTPLPTFVYSTPSYTLQAPRARAVYRLPEPLESADYIKAQKGLFQLLRQDGVTVDMACWNPARWFFGAKADSPSYFLGNDQYIQTLSLDDLHNIRESAPPEPQASSYSNMRPIRSNHKAIGVWVNFWLENLGNGSSILPRDSRHSLLLWISFQMRGQANESVILSVLMELIDRMVAVNGERSITEKELRDLVEYPA